MISTLIPSERYTREYYESCCDGYDEFHRNHGNILPPRLAFALQLAKLQSTMRVLDIGCGRGEIGLHCARIGLTWCGIDYAEEGLRLAQHIRRELNPAQMQCYQLARAKGENLPFDANRFDRIFMLDVVEHLTEFELQHTLHEIRRVLAPHGQLIVHTAPNLWYYRYGYPIYRAVQKLRGHRLPANPRERWSYSDVHINEQTLPRMQQTLKMHGFRARVWIASTQTYAAEPNKFFRRGMRIVSRTFPLKLIFADEIFAVVVKCAS